MAHWLYDSNGPQQWKSKLLREERNPYLAGSQHVQTLCMPSFIDTQEKVSPFMQVSCNSRAWLRLLEVQTLSAWRLAPSVCSARSIALTAGAGQTWHTSGRPTACRSRLLDRTALVGARTTDGHDQSGENIGQTWPISWTVTCTLTKAAWPTTGRERRP